jgi:3-dehydroquinate dehydratase type I
MNTLGAVKIPATVGVIASLEELRAAKRMRALPDLFELRLDCLPELKPENISKLRRPLIVTARHPAEGGNKIRSNRRHDLLLKFLPQAEFVDIELRSLRELRAVWDEAARLHIKRICSVHNFARTPSHRHLQEQFQRAKQAGGDVFKVVTCAQKPDDFLTLLQFLRSTAGRCCVMATGKFGPLSRLVFPECGSVLVYVSVSRPVYPGQLTLAQLRRLRDFYAKTCPRPRNP